MVARAFPNLQPRDDDSLCPETKYVAPDGLIFHTKCSQQLSSASGELWFATDTESKSFEDCMGECGIQRTLCYAVAYHPVNEHCLFFDSQKDLLGDDGDGKLYNVAMANLAQVTPPSDTSCPFTTGAIYTTPSGLEFDIVCNSDYGEDGGDYCPDPIEDYTCYAHADTMEDCMDLCSAAHPLCEGVTYNTNMENGYGNCYLKRDPFAVQKPIPVSDIAHSAQVKRSTLFDVSTECKTDSSYSTDMSDSKYKVSCYESRIGSQNISTTHATSLDQCLNDCSGVDGCKGIVYDMSLGYGYENCYIQNSTGSANHGANATFALRLTTGDHGPSDSRSKAWIAGPVVGAIFALAILVALGLWWRKRRARRNAGPFALDQKQPIYEKDQPKAHEVGPGAHGPYERRYELRDVNSEALLQHEMPRSP